MKAPLLWCFLRMDDQRDPFLRHLQMKDLSLHPCWLQTQCCWC